jgi:hypothetical protein
MSPKGAVLQRYDAHWQGAAECLSFGSEPLYGSVWFEQLLARELPTKIEMYRDLRFRQAAGLLPWRRNLYLIGALYRRPNAPLSLFASASPLRLRLEDLP